MRLHWEFCRHWARVFNWMLIDWVLNLLLESYQQQLILTMLNFPAMHSDKHANLPLCLPPSGSPRINKIWKLTIIFLYKICNKSNKIFKADSTTYYTHIIGIFTYFLITFRPELFQFFRMLYGGWCGLDITTIRYGKTMMEFGIDHWRKWLLYHEDCKHIDEQIRHCKID